MKNIKEILDKFIVQSGFDERQYGPGGQIVKEYPKDFLDLKMKVSFGIGTPARVPWISYLAPGMNTSDGFYPVYLFYKKERKLVLAYGISETKESKTSWPFEIEQNFKRIKEVIDKPPRYGESFKFKLYTIKIENSDTFFIDESLKSCDSNDLERDLTEIINFYKKAVSIEITKETTPIGKKIFSLEEQLEDFIIENWDKTDFGKKYDLIYDEDGHLISQQYVTKIGRIDILAKDKKTKSHVVIELKRNQTSDDTVGQLLRYMSIIEEDKKDNNVKGVIVAAKFDERLKYALKKVNGAEAFLYEVDFNIKEFK
tara:strand:- start:100 stop:1038 length:939 start_codon:yes stop_codon:yes gene_type:complete